jgi:hypothetical protein
MDQRPTQSITKWAFTLFAIVGFISSLIGIYQFFSTPSAILRATLKEYTVALPEKARLSLTEGEKVELESSTDDAIAKKCELVEVGYDGTKSKNYFYDKDDCLALKTTRNKIKSVLSFGEQDRRGFLIDIQNSGSIIASNIKLVSEKPLEVAASRDSKNPVDIKPRDNFKVFLLPDLNPGEKISLDAVEIDPRGDFYIGIDDDEPRPQVSFSGGYTRYEVYSLTSSSMAKLFSLIAELPLFIIIVLGLAIILLLLGIILAPIQLIDAITNGLKPSAIFRNDYGKLRYCDHYRSDHPELLLPLRQASPLMPNEPAAVPIEADTTGG